MKKLVTAILLYFVSLGIAEAQSSYLRTREVRRLPNCTEATRGTVMSVRDATDQSTLGAGGGTAATVVICNTTWTPIASTVSSIDGDPSIVLDTDAAGSDITLTPVDDLIVTVGNDATIATTAGAVAITAGGTTQDITLTSIDDIILAPTDDFTLTGDDIGITMTGDIAVAALSVDWNLGTHDLVMDADEFDLDMTADNSSFDIYSGGAGSFWQLVSDGAASTGLLEAVTVSLDGGGSTNEVTVTAGETAIAGKLNNTAQSETCVAGGGASALTLIPTGNVILITNDDADGCDVTMSETGADAGHVVRIVVISNAGTTVNFADSAGVSEIAGAFTAAVWDSITLVYSGATWVELGRSNN